MTPLIVVSLAAMIWGAFIVSFGLFVSISMPDEKQLARTAIITSGFFLTLIAAYLGGW